MAFPKVIPKYNYGSRDHQAGAGILTAGIAHAASNMPLSFPHAIQSMVSLRMR